MVIQKEITKSTLVDNLTAAYFKCDTYVSSLEPS